VSKPVRIALVGLGYWGPHFARISVEHAGAELLWCCDRSEEALELPKRRYPQVRRTTAIDDVLDDDSVDAVIVATPTATHAALAVPALEAGKHVLVEKPLAASSEEIDQIDAARGDQVVMVGHTFVYNSAIAAIRGLVANGELGNVQYVDSIRAALGPIRHDVNALWDLGAHDASIFLDLLPGRPNVVTAVAQDYLRAGHPDVVYFAVRFDDGVLAHSHVSWLDPYKVRRVTVVGEERMAVFDDVAPDERLKILERGASYDAPAQEARGQSFGEYRAVLREGTITIPRLRGREPLSTQFEEFLAAIRERREPYSGIEQARDVVRVLEAAQRSLEKGGAPEQLETTPAAGAR
jgi:predicted dehydrogenase